MQNISVTDLPLNKYATPSLSLETCVQCHWNSLIFLQHVWWGEETALGLKSFNVMQIGYDCSIAVVLLDVLLQPWMMVIRHNPFCFVKYIYIISFYISPKGKMSSFSLKIFYRSIILLSSMYYQLYISTEPRQGFSMFPTSSLHLSPLVALVSSSLNSNVTKSVHIKSLNNNNNKTKKNKKHRDKSPAS